MTGLTPPKDSVRETTRKFAGVALALADPAEPVLVVAVLLVMGEGAAWQAFGNVLIKRFGLLQPMRLMARLSLFTVPQVGVGSLDGT